MKDAPPKNKTLKTNICAFCKSKLKVETNYINPVCFTCFVITKSFKDSVLLFDNFRGFSSKGKNYWTNKIEEITKTPSR